jgi:metallo-beta-lactamase family protein
MMFHFSRLVRLRRVPSLRVFLDSPMATDITAVFLRHPECLDGETRALFRSGNSPFEFSGLRFVRSQEESKAINTLTRPAVIMAGSGMCTGGRIKHHLVHNISRPESTILFVGYQAEGTLGRQILSRPPAVRIFGEFHPVKARVEQIQAFSGHADRRGLLDWAGHFRPPLPVLFLSHGENESALALARSLREELGFEVTVPGYRDVYELKFPGDS